MRRITPTGFAQTGNRQPVKQLGSVEALMAALPPGAVVITADLVDRQACLNALEAQGREGTGITFIGASGGHYQVQEQGLEKTFGVTPGAFDRIGQAQWTDFHRVLTKRGMKVIWG
jgi:hypothetical protein